MHLKEIMAKDITKIRKSKWADPNAYIELYKGELGYGPWGTLHDNLGEIALGKEEFKKVRKILMLGLNDEDWEEYKEEVK